MARKPFHHGLSTSQYLVELVCLGTHFGKRRPSGLLPTSCQLLLWLFPTLRHFHYWHLAPDFPIITLAALMTLDLKLWTKTLTCPWILDVTLLHPALRLHNPTMRWPQKLHQGQAQNAWVPLVKPKTEIAFGLKKSGEIAFYNSASPLSLCSLYLPPPLSCKSTA